MSTIEEVLSGHISGGGGINVIEGPDAPGSSTPAALDENRFLLGFRLYANSATKAYSSDWVRTDDLLYEARVVNAGYIERSISAPPGPCRIGNCRIGVADPDGALRQLSATETLMRRLFEVVRIHDGALIGGFEVVGVEYEIGITWIEGQDPSSRWLNRPMDSLGTHENFPYMDPNTPDFFFPLVYGRLFSDSATPQGLITLPHIGTTTITGPITVDRYALNRDETHFDTTGKYCDIFRQLPGEVAFTLVDPMEYYVNTETLGLYALTFVDFKVAQDAGAVIRAELYGTTNFSLVDDSVVVSTSDLPPSNPMEFYFYILYNAIVSSGGDTRIERYHSSSIMGLWHYFTDNDIHCVGAITEAKTPAQILAELMTTFNFHHFQNRLNQYQVAKITTEDTGRENITEQYDAKDVTPVAAVSPVNRINYRFAPALGEFTGSGTYDNAADQAQLGITSYHGAADVIEPENVDYFWTRDADYAADATAERAAFVSLGSFRVRFTVPLPEWFEAMELATQKGITFRGGLEPGGWDNKEFVVLSRRDDLTGLEMQVEAILRTPVTY